MTTLPIGGGTGRPLGDRLRATSGHRHLLVPRLGVPLLGIGLAHLVVPDAPMRPLVDAAGFPLPGVIAPREVVVCAAHVLWRGAGGWSLDGRTVSASVGERRDEKTGRGPAIVERDEEPEWDRAADPRRRGVRRPDPVDRLGRGGA